MRIYYEIEDSLIPDFKHIEGTAEDIDLALKESMNSIIDSYNTVSHELLIMTCENAKIQAKWLLRNLENELNEEDGVIKIKLGSTISYTVEGFSPVLTESISAILHFR